MFKHPRIHPSNETRECCKRQRNKVTSLKHKGVKEFCTYAAAAGIMCYISNPSELAEISFNDHFSGMVQAVQLSAESAEFYYPPKC